jgi:hypothetical protein
MHRPKKCALILGLLVCGTCICLKGQRKPVYAPFEKAHYADPSLIGFCSARLGGQRGLGQHRLGSTDGR